MNIILSCTACDYQKGSEWDVGWQFLINILQKHNVWLIAAEEDSAVLEKYRDRSNSKKKLEVVFIKAGWEKIDRVKNPILRQLFFDKKLKQWHKAAYKSALIISKNNRIDLVHKLTPCGFREPGYFWRMNIPSVWGPITGLTHRPVHLQKNISMYNKILYKLKSAISIYQFNYHPKITQAIRGYSYIIPGNETVRNELKERYNITGQQIVQSGLQNNFNFIGRPNNRLENETLNIVWVAKMAPRKSLNLIFDGLKLPELISKNWHLHVVGSGEMENQWKQSIINNEISKKTTFYGMVSRDKVFDILKNGHVFTLLSVSDTAPGVIFEAMGSGLPIICLDTDGFSHIVSYEYGTLIRPWKKDQVTQDFAAAILGMLENETRRFEMAKNALGASRKYLYANHNDKLEEIYKEIVSKRINQTQ